MVKLKKLSTFEKWLFWIMAILSVVSLFVIFYSAHAFITRRKPETLGVTYATTLNSASGELPICEVEIWSNDNNNGQPLYEIKWNSYTDSEGNGVKGFGMQIVGDYDVMYEDEFIEAYKNILNISNPKEAFTKMNNTYFVGESYFYSTDDLGLSSYSLPVEEVEDCLYIDIEDTFYKMNLTTYTLRVIKTDFWSVIKSPFVGNSYKNVEYDHSWYSLSDYVIQSALQDSARADNEVFYINYLDCEDYYELLKYDGRQYNPLPDVSHLRNYLQVKITYHKDGAQTYTDSIFGQIANSVTWTYDDGTDASKYWADEDSIYITEDMLAFLQVEGLDAYYLSIDKEFAKLLNSQSNTKYYIQINLDNISKNVIGIDMTNFNEINSDKINHIRISCTEARQFTILNESTIAPSLSGGLYE